MHPAVQTFNSQLKPVLDAAAILGAPAEAKEAAQQQGVLFPLMEWAIGQLTAEPASAKAERCQTLLQQASLCLKTRVYAHPFWLEENTPPVVFGTGGHRGKIGSGLSMVHVYVIVRALVQQIEDMSPHERLEHCGAASLEEVQQRGIVLGHDNRLFNEEFAGYAAWLLISAGFQVCYAGRIASPQLSLLTPKLGWAGALNFTPSHNPFHYGGIKYNPADGGLASTNLTNPLAERANRLLRGLSPKDWPDQAELQKRIASGRKLAQAAESPEKPSLHDIYLDCLDTHPVVRLKELVAELRAEAKKRPVRLVADPVWGASVPVYQHLQKRLGSDILHLLHTEDDPFFGGQNTEPNPDTLQYAIAVLHNLPENALQIAVRNDPDGDRGLVGDSSGAIKMNRFSALVFKYLLDTGNKGMLITSYATSHFAQQYARDRGCEVHLTPTGFKNFRPWLNSGALMAYEESDGITLANHTLDKDGILSGLLAVRIALHYQQPLGSLMTSLEREIGKYHWRQEAFSINLPAKQAQEKLQLLKKVRQGYMWQTSAGERQVQQVFDEDGYKFIFEDSSWLMLRPSGTEPKMRVYAESRLSETDAIALCNSGKQTALDLIN